MEKEKALELLDLDASATTQEIRNAYKEIYNELQIRITNAPTDHQRKLYNRRLKELEVAYEVLGHSSLEDIGELPNIGPVEMEVPEGESTERSGKMDTEAQNLLGLQKPFTTALLENAFRKKKRELETARLESPIDSIKEFYTTEIEKLEQAYTHLKPLAEDATGDKTKVKRKGVKNGIFLVLAVGVIGTGAFFWLSWDQPPKVDPVQREHFVGLKSQGDLLAGKQEWTEALEKYRRADGIMEDQEVKDSISSIESRLFSMGKEKNEKANLVEEKTWEEAIELKTVAAYQSYLAAYPEGKYTEIAQNRIGVLKEGERTRNLIATKEQENRLTEEKIWEEMTKLGTIAAYESYLAAYPEGKYGETAQKEIGSLKETGRVKNRVVTKELYGLTDSYGNEFNYKGQTKADLPHGKGTGSYLNGQEYYGEYQNGKRHGKGTHSFDSYSAYIGEWKNDLPNGAGVFVYFNGKHKGKFQDGKYWTGAEWKKVF